MKKLTERGRYWHGMIEEHAASGMSIRAFCAERGIAETGLCWWRRERMAPFQFQGLAFHQYPSGYRGNTKWDMARWLARRKRPAAKCLVDPQARPLARSRRFHWANLPWHATLRKPWSESSVA